ncbi:ABC-2 type transport system permease protein [Dethiosulfatibacter aminovorans DSM 17477]|uniref:ABC-2 type transport system permease protein n=1 Tax=Dethiosulfatibacter aminovorans DSM 17477 TaxID=1121476 RepID=A0A1M6F5L6_9FIRM|nr:ABC transporter permease [Dethiosulfatibacter aminovorans]SHI92971.1 ABC-2 type transport system permease protein [Dethiosulfatibacter aminovorans DSM 17477]
MKIFLEAFRKEFRSIFDYAGMMILLFIGPVFLTMFFGGVYVNDYVNDIPVAILDEDGSGLSNTISSSFLSNERFDVEYYPDNRKDLEELLYDGDAHMGIIIPEGFESGASVGDPKEILVVTDGTNIVVSNNAYAQAATIIQTIAVGVEIKVIEAKGVLPQITKNLALSFNIGERVLYDSKMRYMNYLIACYLAVFFQQLMLSSMGSKFIRSKEYIASGNTTQKALGVMASCVAGIMPSMLLGLAGIKYIFHVPVIGSLWTTVLLTILFAFAITGLSMVLASFTKERVEYAKISYMLSLPTFVLAGCVWPLEQMPDALRITTRAVWPLIGYAKNVQEIFIKGKEFGAVVPDIIYLFVFGAVWLYIGVKIFDRSFGSEEAVIDSNDNMDHSLMHAN